VRINCRHAHEQLQTDRYGGPDGQQQSEHPLQRGKGLCHLEISWTSVYKDHLAQFPSARAVQSETAQRGVTDVKPLALALMLCAGLHAEMIFSTGSSFAFLIKGSFGQDTISFLPVSGTAQDGQTLAVPLLLFRDFCFRTDPVCLLNLPGGATITVPISLTDGPGETVTESLSYTASDSMTQAGIHTVTGGLGPAAQFAFSDGEVWTVMQTAALNGSFPDGDQVQFGSLRFAEVSSVPEPSSRGLVAFLLVGLASLRWQQHRISHSQRNKVRVQV
jgi:hypothetical protein